MRAFSLLLLSLTLQPLFSQSLTGTISHVGPDGSPEPIPFATVFLPAQQRGTMTDAQGRFVVDDLMAGTYAVEYSCIGYATFRDTVVVGHKAGSLSEMAEQARSGQPSDPPHEVLLREVAIQLPEVVVGSTDEDPALAVLRRLNASNAANLRRIRSLSATADLAVTQNLSTLPAKLVRILKAVLLLTPYRRLFNLFLAHPELAYAARYDIRYDGKKEKASDLRLTRCTPPLEPKEEKDLLKIFEGAPLCLDYLKPDSWRATSPKMWDKFTWELRGTYDEGGRTVDVIRATYRDTQQTGKWTADYHVIHLSDSPTAEISCALLRLTSKRRTVEMREVAPNLFLPVSSLNDISFDADDRADVQERLDQERDSIAGAEMSSRKRAKAEKELVEHQQMADDIMQLSVKTAYSIRYHHIDVGR